MFSFTFVFISVSVRFSPFCIERMCQMQDLEFSVEVSLQ